MLSLDIFSLEYHWQLPEVLGFAFWASGKKLPSFVIALLPRTHGRRTEGEGKASTLWYHPLGDAVPPKGQEVSLAFLTAGSTGYEVQWKRERGEKKNEEISLTFFGALGLSFSVYQNLI